GSGSHSLRAPAATRSGTRVVAATVDAALRREDHVNPVGRSEQKPRSDVGDDDGEVEAFARNCLEQVTGQDHRRDEEERDEAGATRRSAVAADVSKPVILEDPADA